MDTLLIHHFYLQASSKLPPNFKWNPDKSFPVLGILLAKFYHKIAEVILWVVVKI